MNLKNHTMYDFFICCDIIDMVMYMKDLIIGCHVSFNGSNQLVGSVNEALTYGANTFMFYTGAPQNTIRGPINDYLTAKATNIMKENFINKDDVIIHAPYIINMANHQNRDFAIGFFKQEINRATKLGIGKIVLHPGSHVGCGTEEGIQNIISCLNEVLDSEINVKVLLETMAGKGSEIGSNFEEIKKIIDGIIEKEKIGVCLDTCHLNDAGYDVSDFDKVLFSFDKIIGLDKLLCVHINDSKNKVAAHKDRHENIGIGTIGFESLIKIIYHEKLKDVPKILETPYVGFTDNAKDRVYPPYKFEIEMIKNKLNNDNLLDDIRNYYLN